MKRKFQAIANEVLTKIDCSALLNNKTFRNAVISIGIGTRIPNDIEFEFCTINVISENIDIMKMFENAKVNNCKIIYSGTQSLHEFDERGNVYEQKISFDR